MTPKTQKFRENFDIFCRKILGKCLDLFSRHFSHNFKILVKKWLILQDFAKKFKKKIIFCQKGNLGRSRP